MSYRITFYCPDQHIEFNLHTLDHTGVGGGITARIRVAHALADSGNDVVMYVNCPKNEMIQGVQYRHYSRFDGTEGDIFIVSTSGDGMDLSDLTDISNQVRVRILMVHGINPPVNMIPGDYNFIYAPSNFIRDVVTENWGIRPEQTFVSYHGVMEEYYQASQHYPRDLYSLVYIGHPSKGLDPALSVLRMLRKSDSRWSLHVYGGYQLWGEPAQAIPAEPGLLEHGLIGQKELARTLLQLGFGLNLQSREEPFGMVVTESMQAGCIVLASPSGAYPELIQDGINGFLVPGNPADPDTHLRAAGLILDLMRNPDRMENIRQNAIKTPISWDTVARTWQGHWDWFLSRRENRNALQESRCSICNGRMLLLADGLHCIDCGNYQRIIK